MTLSTLTQPKRGYLAQILTIPPLIYPFQYNPTQVVDSRKLNWQERGVTPRPAGASGFGGLVADLRTAWEHTGKMFSGGQLKSFKHDAERTISFKFLIDGRERRPGEPARRRNEDGDVLADLAIIRSFAYPELIDLAGLAGAVFGAGATDWSQVFFNEPPSTVLVFGSSSVDCYITELKITETQFNKDLNPVRAEVDITMVEKVNSLSAVIDTVKRVGRTFGNSAYEDIGNVLF
jgi:hypothetical protein